MAIWWGAQTKLSIAFFINRYTLNSAWRKKEEENEEEKEINSNKMRWILLQSFQCVCVMGGRVNWHHGGGGVVLLRPHPLHPCVMRSTSGHAKVVLQKKKKKKKSIVIKVDPHNRFLKEKRKKINNFVSQFQSGRLISLANVNRVCIIGG